MLSNDMEFSVNETIDLPANIMPLILVINLETIADAVAYNSLGMSVYWNFEDFHGNLSRVEITLSNSGDYKWTNKGNGMYNITIPASGGGSANNDTAGFGWFTGKCNSTVAWRSPMFAFG